MTVLTAEGPVEKLAEKTPEELREITRGDFRVIREPNTYCQGGEHSYYQDFFLAETRGHYEARQRLKRHGEEWRTDTRERELRALLGNGYEVRVTPNWRPGEGGYFAPPLWLIEAFADVPRAERIIPAFAPNFLLPKGPQSINLPRWTEGPSVDTSVLGAPVPDTDVEDVGLTVPVVTLSGKLDVPTPLLEQSPLGAHLDWMVFTALKSSYDEQLDYQLAFGTGKNGEILGMTNVPGVNSIAYTSGSPLATQMYPYFGKAYAALSSKRKLHPEGWLMRGARWAWLCVGEDEEKRPLGIPDAHNPAPTTAVHLPDPIGGLLAAPVFGLEGIPTTLNGNQDTVIAYRPRDLMVMESDPVTSIDPQPLSGSLQTRLVMHSFVAGVTGREPAGISTMTGTGMEVQSGF